MEEIWKYYYSYKCGCKSSVNVDVYVSNLGRTKSNNKIKNNPTTVGGERIYRVVAKLFCEMPEHLKDIPIEDLQADHLDTNRTNNAAYNLKWATNKENMNNPITKQHCSEAMSKRLSEGVYDNYFLSLKGKIPWNKGLKYHNNKPMSKETKLKMSLAKKGKPNYSSMKQVYQYDKNYNLVQMFKSATQAAEKNNMHPSSIIKVCNGKRKYACGFIFSYTPLAC